MGNMFKWAIVGDLQIPYEDQRAVALWFKVMKWWKPDAIDVTGDLSDCLPYSKYAEGTTDEFFKQIKTQEDPSPLPYVKKTEEGARRFYEKVRSQHPNADIHVSLGNHDVRIFSYIDKKAPEYLPFVTPNTLWGLEDYGMTYRMYHEKPFERFHGIHVHHGVTTSTTGPTAMKDAVDYGVSLIRGHSHRALVAAKHFPIAGRTLYALESGHMCNPSDYGLRYAINPDWDLGFGLVYLAENQSVQMNFIRIQPDYTCVVDGRVFSG